MTVHEFLRAYLPHFRPAEDHPSSGVSVRPPVFESRRWPPPPRRWCRKPENFRRLFYESAAVAEQYNQVCVVRNCFFSLSLSLSLSSSPIPCCKRFDASLRSVEKFSDVVFMVIEKLNSETVEHVAAFRLNIPTARWTLENNVTHIFWGCGIAKLYGRYYSQFCKSRHRHVVSARSLRKFRKNVTLKNQGIRSIFQLSDQIVKMLNMNSSISTP